MNRRLYVGIFLVSLATVCLELVLTRIWSVIMWYHFAFVAISVAMFGLSAAAVVVYLCPRLSRAESTAAVLGWSSLLLGASTVLSLIAQLSMNFQPNRSLSGLAMAAAFYVAISVPFFFSGVFVAFSLTRFVDRVGRVYAADLAGAALGCLIAPVLLSFTDGPSAVLWSAFLACLAGVVVSSGKHRGPIFAALALSLALGLFAAVNSVEAAKQSPMVRIIWTKGEPDEVPVYEKWNAISRVMVVGTPGLKTSPVMWGESESCERKRVVEQLWLSLDATMQTVMTRFAGSLEAVEYLRCDQSNLAFYLRPHGKVLIVGAGGGREVLAALLFGAREVVAVELNRGILEIVNGRYGDFTGHLDRYPNVHFVADEARSFIARQKESFDLIEISAIDTGIASSMGALALTENSLYTVEAWEGFVRHLEPDGLVCCSRWFYVGAPGEVYRLVAVAREALRRSGVEEPLKHIVVVRNTTRVFVPEPGRSRKSSLGTVIVSRRPFKKADLDRLHAEAARLRFEVVQSPRVSRDADLEKLAAGIDLDRLARRLPARIDPPGDDNPFFFYMLKPSALLGGELQTIGTAAIYSKAEVILFQLLVIVTVLAGILTLVPLALVKPKPKPSACLIYGSYFAAIGLGFMLVEVSQMQRLVIFLGHPTYSLSVVLFTLLLSSGLGSFVSQRVMGESVRARAPLALSTVVLALAAYALAMPAVLSVFEAAPTGVRICVSVAALFPVGMLMGGAFPLGFRLAADGERALMPWLWAVNGSFSVVGSVLAVVVAVNSTISTAFWLGVACYAVAGAVIWALSRSGGRTAAESSLQATELPASEA